MTRATRPGSIQSAVAEAYRAFGGIEAVSASLGAGLSTLSYGTEMSDTRPGGLGVNYLDRLGRMDRVAAAPLAQHFAHLAGGVFQPVDLSRAMGADIQRLTAEFSDVLARHADAHSARSPDPQTYTPAEARDQVKELDDLVNAALIMRAALLARVAG